jgi:hypothetical protein
MNAFYEYIKSTYTLEELKYICKYGCEAGIYYSDNRDIFNEHGDDILEIIQELETETGTSILDLSSTDSLYNSIVFSATEFVVSRVLEALGEEL